MPVAAVRLYIYAPSVGKGDHMFPPVPRVGFPPRFFPRFAKAFLSSFPWAPLERACAPDGRHTKANPEGPTQCVSHKRLSSLHRSSRAHPHSMLAPLMMSVCLALTNGIVHHAVPLRSGARPARLRPLMTDRGKSSGGVKGRSNSASRSSKRAIEGDSPSAPAVWSQVPTSFPTMHPAQSVCLTRC